MDSALIASLSTGFIDGFTGLIASNLPQILVFVVGVLVWAVAKKYIFGSARRV